MPKISTSLPTFCITFIPFSRHNHPVSACYAAMQYNAGKTGMLIFAISGAKQEESGALLFAALVDCVHISAMKLAKNNG